MSPDQPTRALAQVKSHAESKVKDHQKMHGLSSFAQTKTKAHTKSKVHHKMSSAKSLAQTGDIYIFDSNDSDWLSDFIANTGGDQE